MENGFAWIGTLFWISIDNCEIELVEQSGERTTTSSLQRGHFKESARWITGRKVNLKLFYTMRMKRILMVLCSHNQVVQQPLSL